MRFNRGNWSPREQEDNKIGILDEELDSDAISEEWYWLQMCDEEDV